MMLDFGFYNMDCMEGMKQFPDKYFDLAIVDPPYGDGKLSDNSGGHGIDSENASTAISIVRRGGGTANRSITSVHQQRKNSRKPDGTWGYANWRNMGDEVCKKIVAWDVAPGQEYFDELFRVSRNQIIWGGNYFDLPPCRCFLIWEKLTISETFTMSMAEYAWTSFNSNAKIFKAMPQSKAEDPRFHPTQKPVELYAWILDLYAKPGMRILDTHAGSASSLVACHRAGLDAWGFEIDETYYKLASERLARERAQVNIMDLMKGEDNFDQLEIAFAK